MFYDLILLDSKILINICNALSFPSPKQQQSNALSWNLLACPM